MKPKKPERSDTDDLFRLRLENIIDLKHPLVRLARLAKLARRCGVKLLQSYVRVGKRKRPPTTAGIVGLTVGGSGGDALRRWRHDIPGQQLVQAVHRVRADAGNDMAQVRSIRSELAPNFSRRSLASWAFSFSASSVFVIKPVLAAASSAVRAASSSSLALSCRRSSSISVRSWPPLLMVGPSTLLWPHPATVSCQVPCGCAGRHPPIISSIHAHNADPKPFRWTIAMNKELLPTTGRRSPKLSCIGNRGFKSVEQCLVLPLHR